MRLREGPFGLHTLDFYGRGVCDADVRRNSSADRPKRLYYVSAYDDARLLVDGFFQGPEEDWPKAQQWLQDMLVLRSGE